MVSKSISVPQENILKADRSLILAFAHIKCKCLYCIMYEMVCLGYFIMHNCFKGNESFLLCSNTPSLMKGSSDWIGLMRPTSIKFTALSPATNKVN